MIPFASIDPAKGRLGAREARRLVREFGVKGFKFHPTMQGFYPMTGSGLSALRGHRRGRRDHALPYRSDRVGAGMRGGMACG